ncbi:MAG: hypothetical protein HY870_11410 [Chloroflexi bacterium]|nr:hypothetical protein [Chloroflexota bacterium]
MKANSIVNRLALGVRAVFAPLWVLLNPRDQIDMALAAILAGTILGFIGMRFYDWPLWVAAIVFLALLLVPGIAKWRGDFRRYGFVAMGVSFLLFTQGFHTIEHVVQWVQYHVMHLSLRESSGILSPANSEWVHFTWNWLVTIILIVLVARGLRNRWAYLFLIWAVGHSLEHTYVFVRYLSVLNELKQLGITNLTAQGLPGIFGEGGWLAHSELTRGTFISRLPGLATAVRLDVHFWWNMGEFTWLILAAVTYVRNIIPARSTAPDQTLHLQTSE